MIQILLSGVFEGLDLLCEVGKTRIYSSTYSFNKLVSGMWQDTISDKSDIVLAFTKFMV